LEPADRVVAAGGLAAARREHPGRARKTREDGIFIWYISP
jgi:hypothetical protein